jgi:hypothetical protein
MPKENAKLIARLQAYLDLLDLDSSDEEDDFVEVGICFLH